jgi:hypothetical protein
MQSRLHNERERRVHPRIYQPMPLAVRGSDFTFDTVTDNLSAGGLLCRSSRKFEEGDTLGFRIKFAMVGSRSPEKPNLAAQGVVTRVRFLEDGTCEFAAKFTRRKLL